MKRTFKPKVCPDCGNEYVPNSGRQERCFACRKELHRKRNRDYSKTAREKKPRKGRGKAINIPKAEETPSRIAARDEQRRSKRPQVNAAVAMAAQERLSKRIPPMANIKDGEEPIDPKEWEQQHGLA